MDNARKKELREQYRQTRPEMGIYAFRCAAGNIVYLGATHELSGTVNSIRFQLKNGAYTPNPALMADWRKYGEEGFSIETLEILEYDKDNEAKTDYGDDLAILKDYWRERLAQEGATVKNVKPKDR